MTDNRKRTLLRPAVLLLVVASLFLSCTEQASPGYKPFAAYVVGKVRLVERSGEEFLLQEGTILEHGQLLKVPSDCRMSIAMGHGDILYLHENTGARIQYLPSSRGGTSTFHVELVFGKLFAALRSSDRGTTLCAISTPKATAMGKEASFEVAHHRHYGVTTVKSIEGTSIVILNDQRKIRVPSCSKVLVRKDGKLTKPVAVSESDLSFLNKWLGEYALEEILASSDCAPLPKEPEINLPPVWNSEPRYTCQPFEPFSDTVTAVDPENGALSYEVVVAPEGFTVDATTGVVSYTPRGSGTSEIRIRATDEKGLYADLRYYLTVTGSVDAILQVPALAKPGEPFVVDASRSVNEKGTSKGLKYRFDTDNNGRWDLPRNGSYGKRSTFKYAFREEGIHVLKVEVKSPSGVSDIASAKIEIDAPPVARITVSPQSGPPGTLFTLDASHSADSRDSADRLVVRWDLNADDTWDSPSSGDFTRDKVVNRMWDEPGVYTVLLQVRDSRGNTGSASLAIPVLKPATMTIEDEPEEPSKPPKPGPVRVPVFDEEIPVGIVAPESTVTKDTVKMRCLLPESKNKVKEYAWDFDGKLTFPLKQKDYAAFHAYSTPGRFTITCKATYEDGESLSYSKNILVYPPGKRNNKPPVADAGKDVISRAGRKVKLYGKGYDPDGKILKYEWDFDGNGTFDYMNDDTGYVTHKFEHYAKAVLVVTDYDGATGSDTIRIIICPETMALSPADSVCVDKYEWPNIRKYVPKLGVSYADAVTACDNLNKRLCTAQEWIHACKAGNKKNNYPYGRSFNESNCNTVGTRRGDNTVAKAGAFHQCGNDYGLFDMSGNAAEWTSTGKNGQKRIYGGWWQSGDKHASCVSYSLVDTTKTYPYVGFRCCK